MLTSQTMEDLRTFASYAQGLGGDERGDVQLSCDRHFRAFGHESLNEVGPTLEFRVRGKEGAVQAQPGRLLGAAGE
jgi:hypothetical protein